LTVRRSNHPAAAVPRGMTWPRRQDLPGDGAASSTVRRAILFYVHAWIRSVTRYNCKRHGHVPFHRLPPPPFALVQPRADPLAGEPPAAGAIRTPASRRRARPATSAAAEVSSEDREAPRSPETSRAPDGVPRLSGARWNRYEGDRGVRVQVPRD